MTTLWHYTCEHGHKEIAETGTILPLIELIDPRMAARLPLAEFAWFTDLSRPLVFALGLTQQIVGCDRTAYRWRVTDTYEVWPWTYVRRELLDDSDARRLAIVRAWVETLEEAYDARPAHWYVSRKPVPVVFDPVEP